MTNKRHTRDSGCCSLNLLKYFMFTYNFFFWLISICLLGVSLWVLISKHPYLPLLNANQFFIATCLMIGVGVIIVFVGSIGCVSIWKEDRCLLKLYIFLLFIIFVCQSLSGVFAFLYHSKMHKELDIQLHETFLKAFNIDDRKTKAIDLLQKKFKCCGIKSFEDWKQSLWIKNLTHIPPYNNTVPDSCCISPSQYCGVRDHPSNIYYDGCLDKFAKVIRENIILISCLGLGFCSIQIIGIIFATCLAIKLKRYQGFTGLYPY